MTASIKIIFDANARLRFEYYVGKKKVDYKPEGDKWLKENLIELIRSTNLGSEQRVSRIYKKSGLNGVLTEIDKIESDFVKEAYYGHIFEIEDITQEEYVTIINSIRKQVNSNHELGRIYNRFPRRQISNRRIAPVYFDAIRHMKADVELSEVMKNIAEMNLDQENITRLVESADVLKEDNEKSLVLNKILEEQKLDQENMQRMIISSERIASEVELSEIFGNMIDLQKISDENAIKILELSNRFSSDYDHARVLGSVIAKMDIKDDILKNILVNVNTLKVDSESSAILKKLITNPDIEEDELIEIIESANDINSDFELTNLLIFVIDNHRITPDILDQLLETADHIESESDYTEVLTRLIIESRDEPDSLEPILEATDRIGAAYDLQNVLLSVMNEYELFDEVIENILIAAENIDSEQEYFEVLSALFSRSTKNPENINYFFDSFDNLLEDYTISMCLMALLNEDYNYSNENVESICMLARKLGSSHEYSYIIFQLVNTIKLDEENSFTILEACQPIVSEGELVNLLVAIGLKMPKDNPELIKAYQRVAGNLQSVADFNKALKVIEK